MNPGAIGNALSHPFISVALPIVFTLFLAISSQNKRFDDLNKRIDELTASTSRRFDEIILRLTRIEAKLDNHEERLIRLEERTSPLRKLG